MTISILNDALLLKKEPVTKLQEYFKSINIDIFDGILSSMPPEDAKQAVLYILCAFSEESPLIVLQQDTKEEKAGICNYLGIPEYLAHQLMDLSTKEIRTAATRYLTEFAGPIFKSYKFLQVQVRDIELDITNRAFTIKKTEVGKNEEPDVITETQDIKEHSKAVTEYARLCKQLDGIEKQIKTSELRRMEGVEDLRKFSREGRENGRIGSTRKGNVETAL